MSLIVNPYVFAVSGIVIDSIARASSFVTYDCGGTPTGNLNWHGTARYVYNVNYNGSGSIAAAVSLVAGITSITPTGGSTAPATSGSVSAVTLDSDGPFAGPGYTRRAVFSFIYTGPMLPAPGSQTADFELDVQNAMVSINTINDALAGSFSCA